MAQRMARRTGLTWMASGRLPSSMSSWTSPLGPGGRGGRPSKLRLARPLYHLHRHKRSRVRLLFCHDIDLDSDLLALHLHCNILTTIAQTPPTARRLHAPLHELTDAHGGTWNVYNASDLIASNSRLRRHPPARATPRLRTGSLFSQGRRMQWSLLSFFHRARCCFAFLRSQRRHILPSPACAQPTLEASSPLYAAASSATCIRYSVSLG